MRSLAVESANVVETAEDPVWTFSRAAERLTLRRQDTEDGMLLVVTENGTPRSYFFSDISRLTTFQVDMEAFLIGSGWSRATGAGQSSPAITWRDHAQRDPPRGDQSVSTSHPLRQGRRLFENDPGR